MYSKEQVRDIAAKAFLLGVDWLSKCLKEDENYQFDEDLYREAAKRAIDKYVIR